MISRRRSLWTVSVMVGALAAFTGVAEAQAPVPVPREAGDGGLIISPTYGQIQANWAMHATDGMASDTYEIRYEQVGTGEDFDTPTLVTDATSPHTISRLMHGMRYIAQVRSVRTAAGVTTRSDWAPSTADDATTPTAPKLATVMDVMAEPLDGGAMVSWTAVADPTGEPLHHYKVTATTEAGFSLTTGTESGDMTELMITGLTNDVEHSVIVQAVPTDVDGEAGPMTRVSAASEAVDVTPSADAGEEDDDDEGMTETPALPLVGLLLLGTGLVAAGRRRLQQ